jgi:hypothetical protein
MGGLIITAAVCVIVIALGLFFNSRLGGLTGDTYALSRNNRGGGTCHNACAAEFFYIIRR